MAIKGFVDPERTSLPRLFKYSLGYRDWENNGAVVSTDHFRPQWLRLETDKPFGKISEREIKKFELLKDKFDKQVVEIYGTNRPKSMLIILPFDEMEKNFPYFLKMYGNGVLNCKGTGYVRERPEKITAEVMKTESEELYGEIVSGAKPQYKDGRCRGQFCPQYKNGKCHPVGNLIFIDPNLSPIGLIQLDTRSATSIQNIYAAEKFMLNQLKIPSIKGFPLELLVTYEQVTPTVLIKGEMRKITTQVPFIKIAPATSVNQAKKGEILDILEKKAITTEIDVDEFDDEIEILQGNPVKEIAHVDTEREEFGVNTEDYSGQTKEYIAEESEKQSKMKELFSELEYSQGVIENVKKRYKTSDALISYLEKQVENKRKADAKHQSEQGKEELF